MESKFKAGDRVELINKEMLDSQLSGKATIERTIDTAVIFGYGPCYLVRWDGKSDSTSVVLEYNLRPINALELIAEELNEEI